MTDTKTCRDCGAEFRRSRADATVRCPACRAKGRRLVEWKTGRTETCRCGKTVLVDGNGRKTGWTCPQCGEDRATMTSRK